MTEVLEDDAVVARATNMLFRRVLDGVLVRSPSMSEPMHLPISGYMVWILLAQPISVRALVSSLADFYDLPAQTIRDDIAPLLKDLQDTGALIVAGMSP